MSSSKKPESQSAQDFGPYLPRSEAEADSLQPTAKPVFPQLMRTADEFNIRSAAGLAEKLYLAVKVVIVDIFERDYLPHLEV